MYKNAARLKNLVENYDLYDDLAKIKAALADATENATGKAGDILSQSLREVKNKSLEVQDSICSRISERPLQFVGLAMLAGAVIGYFIHK